MRVYRQAVRTLQLLFWTMLVLISLTCQVVGYHPLDGEPSQTLHGTGIRMYIGVAG